MTAANAAATAEELQSISLEFIDESPTNPRKTFDKTKLEELAASIQRFGQLQPVLVRPKGERYELVYGARRYRAAKLAKLYNLLCRVRDLTDEEVLEIQIIENAQRDDITPLEEAEAYRELHDRFKRTADEIAAKIGKSREYVYARMKLTELAPEARKALAEGKLSPSAALAVARIPVAALQKEATRELVAKDGEQVSAREATKFVQSRYMLKLADAPFDPKDAKLTAAGACTACPKLAANQPDLAKELGKGANICTDPVCYDKKREAAWKNRVAEAKAAGQAVLSDKETKKVFPYPGAPAHDASFLDLDQQCTQDPKFRTYRQLLGKKMPPVTLARTNDGKVHELIDKKEAMAALKELHSFAKERKSSRPADEVAREKKAKVLRETQRAATAEIVKRAEAKGLDGESFRAFVRGIVRMAPSEAIKAIAKRREIKLGEHHNATIAAFGKAIDAMNNNELRGLAVELVVYAHVGPWNLNYGPTFTELAKLYRVDPKKFTPKKGEKK